MTDSAGILLAEDNDMDVLLIRRAFMDASVPNPLRVVHDGAEAIAYLKGEGPYANRAEYPLPDLLLLDLKMPRVNGFEVLQWIRNEPTLRHVRLVVLTSSDDFNDVKRAYQLGADCFLLKSEDYAQLVNLVRTLQASIPSPETATILVAEDDDDDILFLRRAFEEAQMLNPLFVVRNGEQAIAYLKGEGRFSNRQECPLPALLLLDLKMPGKNGFEVLKWIRNEPSLRNLRVIVLTGSVNKSDLNRAYRLGANSFLPKIPGLAHFALVAQTLHTFWLGNGPGLLGR